MTVELINPEGLPKPDVYRQVAVATGSKLVFLAGQVARDADGGAVGAGELAGTGRASAPQRRHRCRRRRRSFRTSQAHDLRRRLECREVAALGEGVARAAGTLGVDPRRQSRSSASPPSESPTSSSRSRRSPCSTSGVRRARFGEPDAG